MQDFYYPQSQEPFRAVDTIEALRKMLRQQSRRINIKHQYFFITLSKATYAYVKCSKCACRLKYKKQNGVFRLLAFENFHHHQRSNKEQIVNFIKNLPRTMPVNHCKDLVSQKFGINRSRFYYLYRLIHNDLSTVKQFISWLDSNQFQTRYQPFPLEGNEFPDILLTISPQMKDSFGRFGDVVAYDVTYNIVKRIHNRKNWGVGIFWGKNGLNHIIIFGISIINSQTADDFYSLFKSFFQIMNKEPQTILTDQQASLISALERLKNDELWDGIHMLDTYHIIKNLRKRLKNQEILREMRSAIFSESKAQYKKCIEGAYILVHTQQQAQIINQFQQKSNKICFGLADPKFIGFSNSTSHCQKGNDIIKQHIKYEESPLIVIKKIIKIAQILKEKSKKYTICRIPFQDYLKDSSMRILRYMLTEDVYKIVVGNYIKGLSLRPIENNNQWIIRNQDRQIQASIMLSEEKLICNCGYFQKTLTPCPHLLYFIRFFRQDPSRYFGERWLIKSQIQRNNKLGRPRLSRRNLA